jgi:hypothetical protein
VSLRIGKVIWRALMGEALDAAHVLGDLNRHALADPAKPVELVVCQLLEIPDRCSAIFKVSC